MCNLLRQEENIMSGWKRCAWVSCIFSTARLWFKRTTLFLRSFEWVILLTFGWPFWSPVPFSILATSTLLGQLYKNRKLEIPHNIMYKFWKTAENKLNFRWSHHPQESKAASERSVSFYLLHPPTVNQDPLLIYQEISNTGVFCLFRSRAHL